MAEALAQQSPLDPAHDLDPEILYGPSGSTHPIMEAIAVGLGTVFWCGVLFLVAVGLYRSWHSEGVKSEKPLSKLWIHLQLALLFAGFLGLLFLLQTW